MRTIGMDILFWLYSVKSHRHVCVHCHARAFALVEYEQIIDRISIEIQDLRTKAKWCNTCSFFEIYAETWINLFRNSRDARNVEYPKPCSSRTTLIEFHFREIPIVYTTVGFHRRVWIQRINQSDWRGNLQVLKSDFPARLPSQRISCSSPVGHEETRVRLHANYNISYLVVVVPRRPRRYRTISLSLFLSLSLSFSLSLYLSIYLSISISFYCVIHFIISRLTPWILSSSLYYLFSLFLNLLHSFHIPFRCNEEKCRVRITNNE